MILFYHYIKKKPLLHEHTESGVTTSVFPGHGHPIWLQNKLSYCFDVRIRYFFMLYFFHVGSVLGEARREMFSQCCPQGTSSLSSQRSREAFPEALTTEAKQGF